MKIVPEAQTILIQQYYNNNNAKSMQNKKAESQNETRRNTLTILYKIREAYYYYNIDALLGRTDKANVLFCADRYHYAVNDILHGSINNIINSYVKFNTTDARIQTADLLCELLNSRDRSV